MEAHHPAPVAAYHPIRPVLTIVRVFAGRFITALRRGARLWGVLTMAVPDTRSPSAADSPDLNRPPAGSPAQQSPAAMLPTATLPAGGGAIRGIDEKLTVSLAAGSASIAIPIATSPYRHNFGPALSPGYDTGAGNGPLGLRWRLSPSITRKTAR